MDVRFQWAWLLAEWSTKLVPLTGSMREIWGGYRGKCDWSVRGPSLVDQAGCGGDFFCLKSLC